MPKSKRRKPRNNSHRCGDRPYILTLEMQAIPKGDLPNPDDPDDPRRYLRPNWQRLRNASPDACDHTTTGCADCVVQWAETHWLRVRPGGATRWVSLNDAPGMVSLDAVTPDAFI